ncbi:MAG: hypothetical protein ACK4UO_19260 [Pseudolabrys sp.]
MSVDRQKFRIEAGTCLGGDKPAGELVDCVAAHFPDVEVYRENDDLILKGGQRFLVVRRDGPDRFHVTENVSVPSTNIVDTGGGSVRTLDQLIDEISTLAD